jgi:hypothetical protein
MFNNKNIIILQFDIILNNEASVLESLLIIFAWKAPIFIKLVQFQEKLCA